jgi:hypothetical protein
VFVVRNVCRSDGVRVIGSIRAEFIEAVSSQVHQLALPGTILKYFRNNEWFRLLANLASNRTSSIYGV